MRREARRAPRARQVLLQVSTYPQWTYGFALSPGGDVMATCGESSVSAWDAKTGEELMQAERTSDVCLLAIGPALCERVWGLAPVAPPQTSHVAARVSGVAHGCALGLRHIVELRRPRLFL